MIEDSKHVDILGSWRIEERRLIDINKVKTIQLLLLEPYHAKHPWSRVLKGKKVLVIHPLLKQYNINMNKKNIIIQKSRCTT